MEASSENRTREVVEIQPHTYLRYINLIRISRLKRRHAQLRIYT